MSLNQQEIVKAQYKSANNLNTRMSIHEKYSTNKLGFGNWIFSHYDINPHCEILELGCGTGDTWKAPLKELDKSISLVLTDFSEGMLSFARKNLGEHANVYYNIVDIQQIPYENDRFDKVIANMMLYHVPDLEKGLSEVRRVLAPHGAFYCATYGENGILPFLASLLKDFDIKDTTNKNFTLQNGQAILQKYFDSVQKLEYEDSLEVTNLDDMIDYIYSLTSMAELSGIKRDTLKSVLSKHMVNGVLQIPKEYGMFICKK